MTGLEGELRQLGLSEYLGILVAEGFDTWETVLDITESDLHFLNVKIGDRKKLQRAIAEWRGQASNHCLPIVRAKRRYTRHPKPDKHAPPRPPSAYVIFSNHMRKSLQARRLFFTEIAKLVGEQWQILPAEAREDYQRLANARKTKYHVDLAEYKKSYEYDAYQEYLEEFKAKNATSHVGAESNRSKLKTKTITSRSSSTHEYGYRGPDGAASSVGLNSFTLKHEQAELSSTVSPVRLSGYTCPSTATTAATLSLPGSNPAYLAGSSPPLPTSSGSGPKPHEGSPDSRPIATTRDFSERNSGLAIPVCSSSYTHLPTKVSTILPSLAYNLRYDNRVGSPMDPLFQQPIRLPSFTHGDRSAAVEGGCGCVNDPEFVQALPQPVPTLGPTTAPLQKHPRFLHLHNNLRESVRRPYMRL